MAANEVPADPRAPERRRIFISYKNGTLAQTSRWRRFSFKRSRARVTMSSSTSRFLRAPTGRNSFPAEIRSSDFFLVLLSKASTAQGFVLAETVMARESEAVVGRPKILPVRVAFTKNLPLRLSAAIGHLQHFEWRDSADNDALLVTLLEAHRED